jgi:hypothetical protein
MKVSLSAAIAEAAKESLLSSYRSEREQEILKAVERNFHALRRLDQRLAWSFRCSRRWSGWECAPSSTTPRRFQMRPRPRRSSAASSVFTAIWTHWPRIFARANPSSAMFPLPEFDAPSESKTGRTKSPGDGKADPLAPVEKPASPPAAIVHRPQQRIRPRQRMAQRRKAGDCSSRGEK